MLRILVIDDSALMRKLNRDYLESAGFEVEELLPTSATEIQELLKRRRPDLVLSDFNMPHIDGQTVARAVRQTDPTIPVIILTANRDPAREALLQTTGVRKILHKPVTEDQLVEAVSEVLEA